MSVNKEIIAKVEEDSSELDELVNEICDPYTKPLDNSIKQLQIFTSQETSDISSEDLNRSMLFISSSLYALVPCISKTALRGAIASMLKDEKYNEFYSKLTEGTISDKKAVAELQAVEHTVIVELHKRCYERLKLCYSAGENVYSALKKISSQRVAELSLSNRSN